MLKTNDQPACFHCGEDCPDDHFVIDEKQFCCQGCQTVYELLTENQLDSFYAQRDRISARQKASGQERFLALDQPVIVEQLLDFREGSTAKVTLSLPQIHCSACIWLLEKLYKLHPGVQSSRINFLRKEAYITFNIDQISLRELAELLASIGYAPDFNLSDLSRDKKAAKNWRLFYQLGIAGFAFGNSMLLSFPEYLGLDDVSEASYRSVFGLINIALAIPVVWYSAQDYWRAALVNLRSRILTIDIPITLGIITLFARSVYEVLSETGAGYLDSLTGLVFFLLIGKWFQQKTYHRLSFERDYQAYFPIAVRLADGSSKGVKELQQGDTILVRHGELLPADGLLLEGIARMDYSFVTGESLPLTKKAGDQLFAGGRQNGGQISVLINRPISQSYLTRLWDQEAFQKDKEAQHVLTTNRMGKYFTITILAIALISLLYWLPIDTGQAINVFTAVLIIACPCALALAVPFTLGSALRMLGRAGLFLKNTNVIERMQQIDTVVFDKTGTLTEGQQNLGVAYAGRSLSAWEQQAIFSLCRQSSHPLSLAVAEALDQEQASLPVTDFSEVTGKGISGQIEQHQFLVGSAAYLDVGPLLAASGQVFVRINGELAGHFRVQHQYRSSFAGLIDALKHDYKLCLLSGDNERESEFLGQYFPADQLHFRQSPQDKLDFIRKLQEQGKKVLMIGDGLNDAGALRQSEVGMVIAEDTNNFTPASDAILDAAQFARIPELLRYARQSNRLVLYAYGLALIYNVIGLSFAVQGLLSPVVAAILMPLSSITIVAFGVISTRFTATALTRDGRFVDDRPYGPDDRPHGLTEATYMNVGPAND